MSDADTVIAASAALIALLALFATAWQGYLTRTHNRLSVRPVLVWEKNQTTTDLGTEVSYVVRNCGVGPAIVKDRFFTLEGQPFVHEGDGAQVVKALVADALARRFEYRLRQHGLPAPDSAIPAGGEHIIATIFFPDACSRTTDDIVEATADVSFTLRYESLYREPYVLAID